MAQLLKINCGEMKGKIISEPFCETNTLATTYRPHQEAC